MTQEEYFEKLAHHLPEEQREEAMYRMRKAALDGVEHIGLWTGDEPADINDLVGNCPRYRDELHAQGQLVSGLISLARYASK